MATVTMSLEEYEALIAMIRSQSPPMAQMMDNTPMEGEAPRKRRNTAYQRKYKRAFRRIAPKYKLKSGKWKAGGFRKAVKAPHKEASK